MIFAILFFVGLAEMLIVTLWTKVVTETKVWASGFITIINVMIWYYVIGTIVDNIDNWFLAIVYALGCALGTMAGTYYSQLFPPKDKNKKSRSWFKPLI